MWKNYIWYPLLSRKLGHFMGWILCDIYLCPFQSLWVILFTGQIQDQIFVVNNSSFVKRKFLCVRKSCEGLSLPFKKYTYKLFELLCLKDTQTFVCWWIKFDQIREASDRLVLPSVFICADFESQREKAQLPASHCGNVGWWWILLRKQVRNFSLTPARLWRASSRDLVTMINS